MYKIWHHSVFIFEIKHISVGKIREKARCQSNSICQSNSSQWRSLSVWQVTPIRFSCLRWEESKVSDGWEVWFMICHGKIVATLIDYQKEVPPTSVRKGREGGVVIFFDLSLLTYSNLVRKIVRNSQKKLFFPRVSRDCEPSVYVFPDGIIVPFRSSRDMGWNFLWHFFRKVCVWG